MCYSVSKEEVVHKETEEQKNQDPVDWVDVDDDQANVKEPASQVGEVQSVQGQACVREVPACPRSHSPSLVSWS